MTCYYNSEYSPSSLDIILELNPPTNPDNIPIYFNKFVCLLKYTKSFSISSHPVSNTISGFDKSFNLARYLRLKIPNADILFHLTCKDLNKVTIFSRLTLLKAFDIRKILVITGEGYELPKLNRELYYVDSKELVDEIFAHYDNWFDSVSIAGYPGCNLQENQAECARLKEKILSGSQSIYTQCVFSADEYKEFEEEMKAYDQSLRIVPSIAIFRDLNSLKRIVRLTRVKPNEELISELDQLNEVDSGQQYSKNFLLNLCTELQSLPCKPPLNICAFSSFEMTAEVLEELLKKSVNC